VYRTTTFLVAWAPGSEDAGRIGITASKRAVGNSPKRNRTKRLLREWYRLHRHELRQTWDLVIIAQAGAAEMDLKGVEQELGDLITWLNRKTGNTET
jgi:ribonuclease P protein component